MTESLARPDRRIGIRRGSRNTRRGGAVVDAPLGSVASLLTDLLHAQHLLKQYLGELLRPYGLSYPRYEILSLLIRAEDGRMEKVVVDQALERHHTTTRSLVEGLERSGFVESYRNPSDRRGMIISITDRGRRKVEVAEEILTKALCDKGLHGGAVPLAQDLVTNLHTLLDGLLEERPRNGDRADGRGDD
jgi:DNA-binding MarR family transcriptional regulator